MDQIWWPVGIAAKAAGGVSTQTIRNWSKVGKVPRQPVPGGHGAYEYLASAVLEVAAERNRGDPENTEGLRMKNAALTDRNVVLEEVLRRYRWIDERRDEIDRWHREIEELLQGTSPVPNN